MERFVHEKELTSAWHVLGSGAIGSLWATKFLEKSIPCVLLHRCSGEDNKQSQQRLEKQLTLVKLDNSKHVFPIQSLPISAPGKIQKLLICTKSYQCVTAISPLIPYIEQGATVVLLQNGMGQQQQVADLLPGCTVILATTTQGALLSSPLSVTHSGDGNALFGVDDALTDSNSQRQSANMYLDNGINKYVYDDLLSIGMQFKQSIRSILWQKLTINCAINPLTAIHNCRNGELLTTPYYYTHLQQICHEIDQVSNALFYCSDIKSSLALARQVAKGTANNFSSMQQDITNNRKTEIDFINGYLQQQAVGLQLKLPVNLQLIKDIKSLEI
jgi:2-dehydropantoate 2-reductase